MNGIIDNTNAKAIVPPGFRPLRKLAAERDKLLEARQTAAAELRELNHEHEQAVAADRATFAERLRKDTTAKDPGRREQDKVERKITEAQSRYQALVEAVEQTESAIRAAIETHREEWIAAEDSKLEQARQGYAAAIEKLVDARRSFDEARAVVAWITRPKERFKVVTPPVRSRALLGESGGPMAFGKVIGALAEDARLDTERRPLYVASRLGQPIPQTVSEQREQEAELGAA